MNRIKTLQELNLLDRFLFSEVMADNEILRWTSKEASENPWQSAFLIHFHPVSLTARESEDEISVT